MTLNTPGHQTVTVGAPFMADAVSPVTVFALSAHLSVAMPATAAAGTPIPVTVTAQDTLDNTEMGYTGTVHFSSSDVQAGLPANYTFAAADAGSHSFATTLKTVGIQSISVQDAANGLIQGSLAGISVAAAAATHFSISAPSNIVAGTPFSVNVIALDAYGNEASGYRGTIHFSDTASTSGLPANYVFTAADNGAHTFLVTLNSTGVQTLTVSDVNNALIVGTLSLNVGTKAGGGGGGGMTGGGGSGGGKNG